MGNNNIGEILITIGKRIQEQRIREGLQPEDVAEMTGLTAPTIRNIENGSETYLANFIVVCLAINIHPKEILDIALTIEPLFELSDPRKEKTRLTARIDFFISNNFFQVERKSRDVVNELATHYEIITTTSAVSVILARKVGEEILIARKDGNFNVYSTVKKEKD